MTSLYENLPALEASAQEITGRVAELLKESETVQRSAEELLEAVRARRSEAAELADQLRGALKAVEESASEQQEGIETGMGEVESAADAATQGLDAAQGELTQAVETAGEAMSGLQAELAEGGPTLETAERDSDAAVDALGEAIRSGQEELGSAVESAAGEAEALRQAAEQAQERVAQAADALRERMKSVLDQARSRIGQLVEKIQGLGGDHEGTVSGEGARLASGAEGLGQDVQARLEADVRSAVAAQVDAVVSSFGDLAQRIGSVQDMAKVERDVLEGLFGRLVEVMEPLPGAIESVRTAADKVGISWG